MQPGRTNTGETTDQTSAAEVTLLYGLEDRPSTAKTALYALQWLAICLPFIVISGTVAGSHHFTDPALQTVYLQKATFVTSLMFLGQALAGHRLTLTPGPASALLLGILGSSAPPDQIYTAMAVCGILLALLSAAGLFGTVRGLFTPRVIATVLLLIAFTLLPTVIRLLTTGSGGTPGGRLAFGLVVILALFIAHRLLPMAGRSFLIVGGMTVATALFHASFTTTDAGSAVPLWAPFFSNLTTPAFDAGTTLSALFCFLALSLNEIGAMQAVAPLLRPSGMEGRIRRGMTVTGLVNGVAGLLGVIGPVDFSLSPGIIAAGGCGARLPLLPAGALLLLLSFSPALLGTTALIPPTVVGAMLVYALSGQIAAGLTNAFSGGTFSMEDGLVIGGALLTGTLTAFMPPAILAEFPAMLRTVVANGFVVGVVTVLLLDRLFYRTKG